MKLAVEASIAIKWLIEESDSGLADQLLDCGHDFLAPELLVAEVISAACKKPPIGSIGDAQYDDLMVRIVDGPIVYRPMRPLASTTAALVRALDHPVCDGFYLALAEAENVPLITADRQLGAPLEGTPLAGRVRPLR